MAETRIACEMLAAMPEDTDDERMRARVVETALVVSYARAFTKSSVQTLPRALAPAPDTEGGKLHETLMQLRHERYARTDVESGRIVQRIRVEREGDTAHVHHSEQWHPFDRDLLDSIRAHCTELEGRFRHDATRIVVALHNMRNQSP